MIECRGSHAAVILAHKEWPAGAFLLRQRPELPSDAILTVLYRYKPTHHIVACSPSGVYTVNSKVYGDSPQTIDDVSCKPPLIIIIISIRFLDVSLHLLTDSQVIEVLCGDTVPGWPVRLGPCITPEDVQSEVWSSVNEEDNATVAPALPLAPSLDISAEPAPAPETQAAENGDVPSEQIVNLEGPAETVEVVEASSEPIAEPDVVPTPHQIDAPMAATDLDKQPEPLLIEVTPPGQTSLVSAQGLYIWGPEITKLRAEGRKQTTALYRTNWLISLQSYLAVQGVEWHGVSASSAPRAQHGCHSDRLVQRQTDTSYHCANPSWDVYRQRESIRQFADINRRGRFSYLLRLILGICS